jgi:NTP pyrophosphatase (non-canonical NTP hydrolase)
MNKLEKVIKEIEELSKLENKQIPEMFIKFNEEFGEFAAEVIKMIGCSHKPYDEEHLKEEMADALQCLLCLYLKISREKNFDIKEVFEQVLIKNKKWKAKIAEYTHNLKI